MSKQYTAKIGVPDESRTIDSISDREILVPAKDEYYAHKAAMNECDGDQVVLTVSLGSVLVYDHKRGFNPR